MTNGYLYVALTEIPRFEQPSQMRKHQFFIVPAYCRTGELSGGTRQRLGLALLLLPDAPVLLLDEPGLSLDPAWRKRLQDTLRFEAERGKTILLTTHLVAEWNNVAHRCLLCCEGRIERELDPRNLPSDFDLLEPETLNLINIDNGLRSIAF